MTSLLKVKAAHGWHQQAGVSVEESPVITLKKDFHEIIKYAELLRRKLAFSKWKRNANMCHKPTE